VVAGLLRGSGYNIHTLELVHPLY